MTGYIVTKPRPICTILSRLERDLNGHQTNAGDDELLQTIHPLLTQIRVISLYVFMAWTFNYNGQKQTWTVYFKHLIINNCEKAVTFVPVNNGKVEVSDILFYHSSNGFLIMIGTGKYSYCLYCTENKTYRECMIFLGFG